MKIGDLNLTNCKGSGLEEELIVSTRQWGRTSYLALFLVGQSAPSP